MKVLSLIEPGATLIKEKIKTIETRSFKTSYRGELYIHASKTKQQYEFRSNKVKELIKGITLNHEHIICKCNLVDCIYMTKEYVEDIKKNSPIQYACGKYEEGRYAWILENITPLKDKIKAKGQLGIWNYYTEFEILDFMKNIKYGWVDKENNKYYEINDSISNLYVLQSPDEVLKNKIGICWDQVELERYYFRGYDFKTYFIVYYDNKKYPSHTFMTFKKNDKYYWFESSMKNCRGIHEYNSEKEMLFAVRDKFIKIFLNDVYDPMNLCLYEYSKPKYHISPYEFYKHCEKGRQIDFSKL